MKRVGLSPYALALVLGCRGASVIGVPTRCEILDGSFADGTTDPGNDCKVCNYQANPVDWTVLADGTQCPQGICIQQLCQPGCVIDGTAVPEGTDPGDRCRACVPGSSPMAWVYSPDKTPCRPDGGAGAFCVSGVCNGCLAATEVCSNGGDCCSRLCDGQRCFDQSLGGICEDDRSCTPGDRCQDGYCCTSATNRTCGDDRSCCRPTHCTAMGTIGGTCQ